jgi:hypothetical protein
MDGSSNREGPLSDRRRSLFLTYPLGVGDSNTVADVLIGN